MSNNTKLTSHKEITEFLTKILTLGGNYTITPEGSIRLSSEPDTPITFKDATGKERTWYVYNVNIQDPDAILLNPMIEITGAKGMSDNKLPSNLRTFYSTLSINMSMWVWRVMTLFIEGALGKIEVPASIVEDISKISNKVDDKMLKELNNIVEASTTDFCNLYYDRIKQKTTLKICFDDETGEALKAFPKLRAKSKDTFIDILHILFDVPQDKFISEMYSAHSSNMKFPHFESYFNVFIDAWDKLVKYTSTFEDHEYMVEDIKFIRECFDKAEVMRSIMVWSSPSAVVDKPKAAIPPAVPKTTVVDNTPAPVQTQPYQAPVQYQQTPQYVPPAQPVVQQAPVRVDASNFNFNKDGGISGSTGIQSTTNTPPQTQYGYTPNTNMAYNPQQYGYQQQQPYQYQQQFQGNYMQQDPYAAYNQQPGYVQQQPSQLTYGLPLTRY